MANHGTLTKIVNYCTIAFVALPLLSNLVSNFLGGVAYVAIAYCLAILVLSLNTKPATGGDKYFAYGMLFFILFLSIYSFGTQLFSNHFAIKSFLSLDFTMALSNHLINLPLYLSGFVVFFKSNQKWNFVA